MTPETPVASIPAVSSRMERWLQSRFGLWILGLISFAESAFLLPIITDPFMMVYIIANQTRYIRAIVVTTATSVLGGVAAYVMAYYFSATILSWFSSDTLVEFTELSIRFQEETFVLTILGAITPIPYTLVGLAAGFVEGSLLVFILASVLGRALRYGVVGYLTHIFGPFAVKHIKKHLTWLSIVTAVIVLAYLLL